MQRILLLILSTTLLAIVAVLGMGYVSAPTYEDAMTVDLAFSPELTWVELINVQDIPLKKSDVASVEIVDQYGKLLAWKENLKGGGYRLYRMNERLEDRRLVVELSESSYGLTGIWSFDLRQTERGSEVLISEKSRLDNVRIRGVRYFLGRNHDLLVWAKYIRVGLTERLLTTP